MGDVGHSLSVQEREQLLESLAERKILEKWQKRFCGIANVFVCCADLQGNLLTELDGKEGERDRISGLIDEEQFRDMCLRVCESDLEDQAVETTAYPNLRLGVVSSRIQGRPLVNWLICGVLSESGDAQEYENPPLEGFSSLLSENQFLRAVDTLRDIMDAVFAEQLQMLRRSAESEKLRRSEAELREEIRRSETLRGMMWLLEGGETPEADCSRILKSAGAYLQISEAFLYCMPEENRQGSREGSIIADWRKDGESQALTAEKAWKDISILQAGRPMILSADSMLSLDEREEMKALGFTALIVMPVVTGESEKIHVCFGTGDGQRVWTLEEIRFSGDVVKILQGILKKRSGKSRTTSASGRKKSNRSKK